jgi:hypothetical protein
MIPTQKAALACALLALACSAAPAAPERSASAHPASEHSAAEPSGPVVRPAVSGVRVDLTVRETAGIARTGEVATTGIPIPRSLGLSDIRGLAVVDPAGKPVAAEFRVLARWNAGLQEAGAPVQWLLVSFPAAVPAKGSAVYKLVTDGSAGPNPAPAQPLKLTQDGSRITVDTGAAVFRLGGSPGALFDEVRLTDGNRRLLSVGGGAAAAELTTGGADGKIGTLSTARRVWIEHTGPLTAAVVVDGAYDLPQVGRGGFGSRRRYVFTAGSPTALVRQVTTWEGSLACPGCMLTDDKKVNGVLFTRMRDTLTLDPEGLGAASGLDVAAVGAFKAAAVEGRTALGKPEAAGPRAGDLAVVRQALRSKRQDPLAFTVEVAGHRATGQKADGGMLAVSGAGGKGGTVAVAFNHMHRYEPQALRLSADGRIALDLADDKFWLAHNQGMLAVLAVSALPGKASRADLDRRVWAPLNRPLRAWPAASWWNGSGAVGEIPAGPLPHALASYDELIPGVLNKTLERIDSEGTAGLMTFGVFPRYWGQWNFSELDCKNDRTPGETWDDTFWCGTWTDYHDTAATVPVWVMRTGDVQWLDEIAVPAALRVLDTQVMQCAPGERWFYCGQAPAGYGGYRDDFNSSHAYFDNLFLYYWLTGDGTVVDTLRRGGENMRRLLCESRGKQPVTEVHGPDGPACAATQPINKGTFTGRVSGQWLSAFRFLGLASEDGSFLEDWKSGLARAVTQQYAEVERDGRRYGFLGDKSLDGPGPHQAGPLWMNAFYDAENLYRYQVDTGDAPLGDPPVRPSQVLAAVARTMADLVPQASGKRVGLRDPWPQDLTYRWSGARIGGKLTSLTGEGRDLYGPEKAGMAALLVREGQDTGDRAVLDAGRDMVQLILSAARDEQVPLGKLQGQYLTRLHAAVARLAQPPAKQKEK